MGASSLLRSGLPAGGQNYHVIEQDGERLAVPAGDKPEHDRGDEIIASRTREGVETGEAYGHGHGHGR